MLLLASIAACSSGGSTAVPVDPPDARPLTVHAGSSTLLTGDTLHLSATDPGGGAIPAGSVKWTSSNPAVAVASAEGELAAISQGSATITATRGEQSGTVSVTVWTGSGTRIPGMTSFDRLIPALMARWSIPGGAVAVVKDGRLVFARGYGYADREAKRGAEPDALFRIASVSKPVTAAAILQLYERGLLELDAKAFDLIGDLDAPAGATVDPRLEGITVRQLLTHSGGWDRDASFDPMFRPAIAAEAVGAPAPASAETVIRYMMGQPLQFDPGSRYAYSNFGYAVLGRIIERVTGMPYEAYVRSEVLAPLDIQRMRIGHSLLAERPADEVRYYDPAVAPSVFPGGGEVPIPNGGFYLEAMDAHGGWIASTVDLLRFLTAVDGREDRPDLLQPLTIDLMISRPPPPLWTGSSYYYAMGWLVRPTSGDANWWHDGSLPGTTALLVRAYNGLAWAALFNARASGGGASFAADLDAALWEAAGTVTEWPAHDLFAQHP